MSLKKLIHEKFQGRRKANGGVADNVQELGRDEVI